MFLSTDEAEVWIAYRQLKRTVDAAIAADLLAHSGLSEADYDVLSNLSTSGVCERRVLELAEQLRWSKSRASNQLVRMEQRGMITREGCGTDGRGSVVRLTKLGRSAIVRAAPAHVKSVRRQFLDRLDPTARRGILQSAKLIGESQAAGRV